MMAVLGLGVGRSSYRRLFSAIRSLVDKGIGPDNTRRALLHQTADELELMNTRRELDDIKKDGRPRPLFVRSHDNTRVIRARGPKIFDPNMKSHTDLLHLLGKAKERGFPKASARFPEEKSDLRVIGKGFNRLIPKAVQPFHSYPSDEGIRPSQLPIRYSVSSSLCLYTLVNVRPGILTDYQTRNLDQVCITGPTGDESSMMFEELLRNCEDFYGALGICYRVVAKKSKLSVDEDSMYILQGWFPASQTYKVLASCSRHSDCQLFETQYGKRSNEHPGQRVHLLQSTLMVTEDTISIVLENHQKEDGVEVPEVLGLYMGGKSFLPFRFKYAPRRGCVPQKSPLLN